MSFQNEFCFLLPLFVESKRLRHGQDDIVMTPPSLMLPLNEDIGDRSMEFTCKKVSGKIQANTGILQKQTEKQQDQNLSAVP